MDNKSRSYYHTKLNTIRCYIQNCRFDLSLRISIFIGAFSGAVALLWGLLYYDSFVALALALFLFFASVVILYFLSSFVVLSFLLLCSIVIPQNRWTTPLSVLCASVGTTHAYLYDLDISGYWLFSIFIIFWFIFQTLFETLAALISRITDLIGQLGRTMPDDE